MDYKLLQNMVGTSEGDMESKINIPKEKIINFLILCIIGCGFLGGYFYGQITMGNDMKDYYEEYINRNCYCVEAYNPSYYTPVDDNHNTSDYPRLFQE